MSPLATENEFIINDARWEGVLMGRTNGTGSFTLCLPRRLYRPLLLGGDTREAHQGCALCYKKSKTRIKARETTASIHVYSSLLLLCFVSV